MEARCQFNAIRFTTPLPHPLHIHVCHCSSCRLQSASAFGISAIFPYFTPPQTSSSHPAHEQLGCYTKTNLHGQGDLHHYFCRSCGTRLMHASEKDSEEVYVKGGCLEGLNRRMMSGAAHIWAKEAVVDVDGLNSGKGEVFEEGYPGGYCPWRQKTEMDRSRG